jgi:hypothetical protein
LSNLKDKISDLFSKKSAKKRIRKETGQPEPYDRPNAEETAREKAVRLANEKEDEASKRRGFDRRSRKATGSDFDCGGVKYSKLKERMKGKKKD